jgi:protein-L-isoaspartate(D-aspartate) O-methyltransferase
MTALPFKHQASSVAAGSRQAQDGVAIVGRTDFATARISCRAAPGLLRALHSRMNRSRDAHPASCNRESAGMTRVNPAAGRDRDTPEARDLDPQEARELRGRLVSQLTLLGELQTDALKRALSRVPRHLFVPPDENHLQSAGASPTTAEPNGDGARLEAAYANAPVSIGQGQTISQPVVVALMSEALELTGRERVLEVGTGSGYQAAVLAELAREVYSVEILPELARWSAGVLERLGYQNVHVLCGDGSRGWPEHAPFDRVVVTAAVPDVPQAWFDQLAEGGLLVAPVDEQLMRFRKRAGRTTSESLGLVAFVPLLDAAAANE